MNRYLNSFLNSFQTKLEAPVKEHLKNVYGTLALTTTSAVVGSYVNFAIGSPAGFLTSVGALIALITLCMTPDNGKNLRYRLGLLLGFAFLSGLNLGPVLQLALIINPAIIQTALIGTITVFVSFTMSAIYSSRGSWLYLGGILGSVLSSMLLISFANLFFRSALLSSAHLYLGLAAMCAFILFDTQAIIEKRRAGSKDFISHSLDLFIDVLQVFRHLMVVLMDKEERRQKKKN